MAQENIHTGSTNEVSSAIGTQKDNSTPSILSSPSSDSTQTYLTNGILRLSYDGYRFTGWSAANTGGNNGQQQQKQSSHSQGLTRPKKKYRRRGAIGELKPGHVRSVEGVVRENLAKIYGNVDPQRVIVEGCSRTDKGVHAHGMVAQFYCLKEGILEQMTQPNDDTSTLSTINDIHCSIPGKRKPHPISSTDNSYFEPMPMGGNLSRIAFALNRMKPSDVQVTGIAPTPSLSSQEKEFDDENPDEEQRLPFHPSLTAKSKTYCYRFSVGVIHDPTLQWVVWHVPTTNGSIDVNKIQKGCQILEGTHDFSAFQGAPRGSSDKQRRQQQQENESNDAFKCTLSSVQIEQVKPNIVSESYFIGLEPPIQQYQIKITGNRFLYKMVRFLVGSLVAVGNGKLELEDLENALDNGNWNYEICEDEQEGREVVNTDGVEDDERMSNNTVEEQPPSNRIRATRRKEFQCAPAHGLVLESVDYGSDIQFDWKPLRDLSNIK